MLFLTHPFRKRFALPCIDQTILHPLAKQPQRHFKAYVPRVDPLDLGGKGIHMLEGDAGDFLPDKMLISPALPYRPPAVINMGLGVDACPTVDGAHGLAAFDETAFCLVHGRKKIGGGKLCHFRGVCPKDFERFVWDGQIKGGAFGFVSVDWPDGDHAVVEIDIVLGETGQGGYSEGEKGADSCQCPYLQGRVGGLGKDFEFSQQGANAFDIDDGRVVLCLGFLKEFCQIACWWFFEQTDLHGECENSRKEGGAFTGCCGVFEGKILKSDGEIAS